MIWIDSVIARHDPTCNVEIDKTNELTCNCGSFVAQAQLKAMRRTLELARRALFYSMPFYDCNDRITWEVIKQIDEILDEQK